MAFNGSGTHNRVHSWATDKTNTVAVTASRMDAEHNDISTALSNTICKDGQQTATARIPFALGVSAMSGLVSSVSYGHIGDLNTGLYFPAADQWGLSAGGTGTLTSTATKITTTVAIDFGGAAAPTSSDGAALGSTTQMWSDLFLASGAVINFNNGGVTVTEASDSLVFSGGQTYQFSAVVHPSSDDGAALGTTTSRWSDLFLASGGVINFNNGDVAVTHSANNLAVSGGVLEASGGLNVSGGTVTLPAKSIAGTAFPNGAVVNRAYAEVTAYTTTSTATPDDDDTVPLVTEGDELLSTSITTASATNRVRVTVNGPVCGSAGAGASFALFHGSTCIDAWIEFFGDTNEIRSFTKIVEHVPGSAASQSYSLRFGLCAGGGTIRINGDGSGRKFGGASSATMVLEELQAA